jgi:hypothetical protein
VDEGIEARMSPLGLIFSIQSFCDRMDAGENHTAEQSERL